MVEPTPFGRRRVANPAKTGGAAAAPAPRPSGDPLALTPAAEAFRAELKAGPGREPSAFSHWRRDRRAKRYLVWLLSLALLSPGVLCFIFQTPWQVSGGLELIGVAANWWLRRERRRHLKEIAEWEPASA